MHKITSANKYQLNGFEVVVTPKKNPIKAKGIANMECANNTSEKYFFIFGNLLILVEASNLLTINFNLYCWLSKIVDQSQVLQNFRLLHEQIVKVDLFLALFLMK